MTDGPTDKYGILLISVANGSKAQIISRAEFESPVHIGIQMVTERVKASLY